MRLKPVYVFNFLAIFIVTVFFVVYYMFQNVQTLVVNTNFYSNLQYVQNITDNIVNEIKNEISITKLQNPKIRNNISKLLSLFVTNRYKYIYIVDKNSGDFRFLVDGSKEDRAAFLEPYEPIELKKWNEVYKTKKDIYFTHKNIESLWMTYLKPIVIDNKVKAILVIDFSMKEHSKIENSLQYLNNIFKFLIYLFIFIFIIIVWFSFIDAKKEKQLSELNKTLEKRVQEEILKNREKDKQLFYQSRLAQMGEMISMIAHQWRQPLASISAVIISIKFKAQMNQLDKEFILQKMESLMNYTQYLSHTIDDFREFFKPTKQKELVSFEEIMQSVLDIIGVSLKNRGIELSMKIEYKDKFLVFSNELKQVILNLIKNAEDVLSETNLKHKKINIKIYKKENIIFEIEDNGGGIKEDISDKIFEPYFSTKDKNGTGIGLYMSKMIVQKHLNGELIFQNTDNGVLFKIILKEEK